MWHQEHATLSLIAVLFCMPHICCNHTFSRWPQCWAMNLARSRHRKRVERPPLSTLCKGLGGMTTCKLWDGPRLANIRGSHSNPGIKIQSHFVLWDKDLGPLSRWMDTARPEEGQAGGGCYSQREGPEGEMALL